MVAAVPTLVQVIDGVHSVVSGIGSIGTVLKRDHQYEDDVEFLEVNGYLNVPSAGAMDLWVIYNDPTSPFEGEGVGEEYDRFNIRIRYWSVRTNEPDWQKLAREKAQSVVDTLEDNAAVFKIGGQPQLFTPTTVAMDGPYQRQIRDIARTAGQMVYETMLSFTVEARRWS